MVILTGCSYLQENVWPFACWTKRKWSLHNTVVTVALRGGLLGGGGTSYIQMIGMIVVSFRGSNQQFSIL